MSDESPIFILGMTPRSGTNYLLHHAHQLASYVNSVPGEHSIDWKHKPKSAEFDAMRSGLLAAWWYVLKGISSREPERSGLGHGRSGG